MTPTPRMTSSDIAAIPGHVTATGIRRLSLSSISLLQLFRNPYLGVILDGDEPPQNRLELLKFLFIHAAPLDDVLTVCLAARTQPDLLNAAALKWGADISPEAAAAMMADFNADKDDIANVSTSIISDGNQHASKNLQSHQR